MTIALIVDNKQKISSVIKERIIKAGRSFHANDTIYEHINENEFVQLHEEVTQNVQTLLDSLVIDTVNDHNTHETAKRMAKKYLNEIFKGRYNHPPTITEFPNFKNLDEIYTVGPILMRSTCSHHFAPIMGKVWIGVIPGDKVIGLSKFSRIVDWVMSRPHIQEEAVISLTEYIEETIKPRGLAILMKAKHFCMIWRGVKDSDTVMTNLVVRGCLVDKEQQRIFLEMVKES